MSPTMFRSAGWARPMRSPRPWCFSPPMTQASSREQNCLWTEVSHKCRGSQLENSDPPGMRTRLQSPATWMQKLRAFFEALRLDDIAFLRVGTLEPQSRRIGKHWTWVRLSEAQAPLRPDMTRKIDSKVLSNFISTPTLGFWPRPCTNRAFIRSLHHDRAHSFPGH